nr:MAG TPA: hypothetical protein [Bacteriophage sp.]
MASFPTLCHFLAQAGSENRKKNFFGSHHRTPLFALNTPRTPLIVNLLHSKDDEMNLVTT